MKTALEGRGVPTSVAEITRIPQSTVKVDAEAGRRLLRLLDDLEEHDDIQSVTSNFEMDDAVMAQLGAEN